jgi:hypothetical protein
MRYGLRLACFSAAQQAEVQAPEQSASHAAVHWLLPLQQSDVASSTMIAANSVVAAVHLAAAASVVPFCFAHEHSLQHLQFSPQQPEVAVVDTAVAATSVDDDLAAALACWQHD